MNSSITSSSPPAAPAEPLLKSAPANKRRVQFSAEPVVIPTASPLNELNDWSGVWYNLNDLEAFRNSARDQCRRLRSGADTAGRPTLALDGTSRGLEQRCCLERQRRKYLATRCIVKAQSKLVGDRLAELAAKCTTWAAELAVEEAARDYSRAWNAPSSAVKRTAQDASIVSDDSDSEDARRVRPRL